MSFDTARKVVDFATEITPPGQRITIGFFGGEPLLQYPLMKKIIHYARQATSSHNARNSFFFRITTNGTLLDEQKLSYLRQENIGLCISIDGPAQIHNRNRRYKDGRGSFDTVSKNLRLALAIYGNVQVNAVYGPETYPFLREVISSFRDVGVSSIHLNPDICASWDKITFSKLHSSYRAAADEYIQAYHSGHEIGINLFDSKIILLIKGGYGSEDKCKMGEAEWAFAPSGNIYPCERFIGDDTNSALCLGNIHEGLNQEAIGCIIKQRGNHSPKCSQCDLQRYCMNWCGCTNYYTSGYTDVTGQIQCESEKALIRAAKHILVELKDNDLFVDHFLKYAHEERYSP